MKNQLTINEIKKRLKEAEEEEKSGELVSFEDIEKAVFGEYQA